MLLNGKWRIDLDTPHQEYRNSQGKRLPGVTTVLGNLDKPALRGWYADMERRHVVAWAEAVFLEARANSATEFGRVMRERLGEKWAADVKKDRAADVGTVTHARCEAFVKGPYPLDEEGLSPELIAGSMPGFLRFQEMWAREGLVLLHSEFQMVSEAMQVGGTADIIARRPDGALVLKDLKTSKASKWWPYDEVIAQVAAYAEMYEELTGRHVDVIEVERIGKEENDAGQSYRLSDMERAGGLKLFRAALDVHNAKKEIGR